MATFSEVMRYALDLDVDGFMSGLRKAEKGADDTFDSIEDSGESTARGFNGLGGKMGTAIVAGFSAIGVGALLMQGINQAMDAQQGVNRLQGQFALTAEEAERYGKIAGGVYRDAWGDSLEEVQQAVGLAAQQLEITNEDALAGITENVLATASTFDVEFSDVIRAVSQMLENGLAPDAETALDTVVRAFQAGGDQADDLLDTIIEYSQHWGAVGLDGEAALNQVIAGFESGQRDADKMADAVKEMRLRIVEDSDAVRDALKNVGLNADEIVDAFKDGGPAAKEAFLEVVGALRDGQRQGDDTADAVAILGTQIEDLGPKGLDALAEVVGHLKDTENAANELADTVGDDSQWEQFKRNANGALGKIGNVALPFLNNSFEETGDLVDGLTFQGWSDDAEESSEAIVDAVEEVKTATWELTEAQREQYTEALLTAQAEEELALQATIASEAMRDEAKAANRIATTLGRLEDDTEDLADATEDLGDEVSETDKAFGELLGTISRREEYRSAIDSIDAYRDALAEADAALAEGEISAREYQETVDREFDQMAASVGEYVLSLEDIPEERKTEVLAAMRAGDLERLEEAIAAATRAREIVVSYRTIGSPSAPTVTPGNTTGIRHTGGRTSEPVGILAGETFIPNSPGRVLSREDSSRSAGGGDIHVHIDGNVYGVDHLEQAIADGVRKAQRSTQMSLRAGRR